MIIGKTDSGESIIETSKSLMAILTPEQRHVSSLAAFSSL